jgi:hypothetical protein
MGDGAYSNRGPPAVRADHEFYSRPRAASRYTRLSKSLRVRGVSPFGPTTWSSGIWWLVLHHPAPQTGGSVGFQFGGLNAQASSGDVQSSAGAAPDRERPHWISPQLPLLLGEHRAITLVDAAGTAFSRHASLHAVRPRGAVHRGCRLARLSRRTRFLHALTPSLPCVLLVRERFVLRGNTTVGSPYPNQPGNTRESSRHRVQSHQQSHREGEDHLQWHALPEQ